MAKFGFAATISAAAIISDTRSHLKKVFSPDIGVVPSSQVLDILEYVPQGHFLRGAYGVDPRSRLDLERKS